MTRDAIEHFVEGSGHIISSIAHRVKDMRGEAFASPPF